MIEGLRQALGGERRPRPERFTARTRDGWNLALYRYLPEDGAHRTPVVLCHGMGSNRWNMDGPGDISLARYLRARGWDVWVVELRGSGRSTKPSWLNFKRYNWTFEDYVQHDGPALLRRVLEVTRARRVHWVGHSMGGMIAYALLMTPVQSKIASAVTLGSPTMSNVGHPLLDLGIWYSRLLHVAPPRLPTGTLARLGAPAAPLLRRLLAAHIEQLGWHRDNSDAELLRHLMWNAVEDLPASLLQEFAQWYETRVMSDRYGMFDFTEHLERIKTPIFVIAGSKDGLTPPRDLEHVHRQIGSEDKVFQVIGRRQGFGHDYSHADLVLGRHAPDDVYPLVHDWLEQHRTQSASSRQKSTGRPQAAGRRARGGRGPLSVVRDH